MSLENIIKKQIDELTDFDTEKLNHQTKIEDIGLASLDFLAIQVDIKRQLGLDIDLNRLAEANLVTYGDLVNYIKENYPVTQA